MELLINDSPNRKLNEYRMEHGDELNGWLSFCAGPIGAVAYATMQESVPPRRMLVMAFVGSVVSVFMAPWACLFFGLADPRAQAGIGFVFGMLGMQAARTLITWAEKSLPHAFSLFLIRMLGPGVKTLLPEHHEKLVEEVEALKKAVKPEEKNADKI